MTESINYRGLQIPFVSFGNVTSDDLFCDKEQKIFDFYIANKDRYHRALDIGANIGVHTILMARQGWDIQAYEPDPDHYEWLVSNLVRDFQSRIHEARPEVIFQNKAVSDVGGWHRFIRVKGNTTSNHLKGDKKPYGEIDEIEVETVDCRPLFDWADFAKIDCEGHEARLLLTVTPEQARTTDFMVEVGNPKNADLIYRHFESLPTRLWAQKDNWREVINIHDMPTHHSHGALFIGQKEPFPANQL